MMLIGDDWRDESNVSVCCLKQIPSQFRQSCAGGVALFNEQFKLCVLNLQNV